MLFLITLGILIILLANIADNLWPPSAKPSLQAARAAELSELEEVTIVPKVVNNAPKRVREKRADKEAVAAVK